MSPKRRQPPRRPLTILQVMDDSALLGGAFMPPDHWAGWRACLAGMFALPMSEPMKAIARARTRRETFPARPVREAWLVVGRRGGKSRISALVAVWLAVFGDYSQVLAPGERARIMVIAADRKQAGVVLGYVAGLLDESPLLAPLVQSRTEEAIHLTTGISIEVHTASYRAVRGYTVLAAICDEIAFWRSEDSANPDVEILNALRPAMATVPGALLLGLSSPYAQRGALWDAYRTHYGQESPSVLVWQADSQTMNPRLDRAFIAAQYAADAARAAAEYGAEFRHDVEAFLPRDAVEACRVPGRREVLPIPGVEYTAFVDPSGGSHDSMTLAIAHVERGRTVLDLACEWRPPFSPDAVVEECVQTLRVYGCTRMTGDRYGGAWPAERFTTRGIQYVVADRTKSDFYHDLLPLVNASRVELLDHPRLITQCLTLERRIVRGGRDRVDHPVGGHDDLANAAAGALVLATTRASRRPLIFGFGGDLQVYDPSLEPDPCQWDPAVDAEEPAAVDAQGTVPIRFLQKMAPYNAGEIAGFPLAQATQYVECHLARWVRRPPVG
jgi:hypothetical protein